MLLLRVHRRLFAVHHNNIRERLPLHRQQEFIYLFVVSSFCPNFVGSQSVIRVHLWFLHSRRWHPFGMRSKMMIGTGGVAVLIHRLIA